MRSAALCALIAASSISARTVWGDYYSVTGRVEEIEYTDTTHTTIDPTTDATVITTTTDSSSSTTTTDDLEQVVKEIESIVDEMVVDGADTLFTVDIELSASITAAVNALEGVLGSASTVTNATSNPAAGLASATDPVTGEGIIVTSTGRLIGINFTTVDDTEESVADDLGAVADATYAAGNLTIIEGAGAATSGSGMEVLADEGADIITVNDLEVALTDDPDTTISGVAAATYPAIIDDGTDFAIISEVSPKATVTTGGGVAASGITIAGGPGGSSTTTIAPGKAAGGGSIAGGAAIVSGPRGINVTAIPGTGAGSDGAGTKRSVTGAGGNKNRGTGTGGIWGRGARGNSTGARAGGEGARIGGGATSARGIGAGTGGIISGGAGSAGTKGNVAGVGGTKPGGPGAGARGIGVGGRVTTLITTTRTSAIAFSTVTANGPGRSGGSITGGITGNPPNGLLFDRCMKSADSCFRAARRGAVPYSQCQALRASCRRLRDGFKEGSGLFCCSGFDGARGYSRLKSPAPVIFRAISEGASTVKTVPTGQRPSSFGKAKANGANTLHHSFTIVFGEGIIEPLSLPLIFVGGSSALQLIPKNSESSILTPPSPPPYHQLFEPSLIFTIPNILITLLFFFCFEQQYPALFEYQRSLLSYFALTKLELELQFHKIKYLLVRRSIPFITMLATRRSSGPRSYRSATRHMRQYNALPYHNYSSTAEPAYRATEVGSCARMETRTAGGLSATVVVDETTDGRQYTYGWFRESPLDLDSVPMTFFCTVPERNTYDDDEPEIRLLFREITRAVRRRTHRNDPHRYFELVLRTPCQVFDPFTGVRRNRWQAIGRTRPIPVPPPLRFQSAPQQLEVINGCQCLIVFFHYAAGTPWLSGGMQVENSTDQQPQQTSQPSHVQEFESQWEGNFNSGEVNSPSTWNDDLERIIAGIRDLL
ncbi:hypothetical protein HOY82DRAFT_607163 [Tuber indicum]|nr:hypothetical protein HOY82DRAFT_607163 [Tuber indicum]